MRIGLALPHYDFSIPGRCPLPFEAIAQTAERAEALGFESLWVSDHLTLSIERYGGGPGEHFAYEPLTTLAALSRRVRTARLGTLVLCEALRPASVAAKALATLDRICGGRLDIGVGAGWSPSDYTAVGLEMPTPGKRVERLEEALAVLDRMLADSRPPASQAPRPPLFVGGKGDRVIRLAAQRSDGWNISWACTPGGYAQRRGVFDRACADAGRDPATMIRSLGLYALVGEDHGDLRRRWDRMVLGAPGGLLDRLTLDEWRQGRLVGTVDEVAEQVAAWRACGVTELIACAGPIPFSLPNIDDLEVLAIAMGRGRR